MKINLHCHTNYSDGADIFEMAREHKEQGFSAFVTTDHVYPFDAPEDSYSLCSYEKFQRQSYQLEQISKQLKFPCIQGMELALWGEEILVFGAQAYEQIFQFKSNIDLQEQKSLPPKDYAQKHMAELIQILAENRDNTAIILCHPHLGPGSDWVLNPLYPLLDGYEFQNSGHYYFTDETNVNEAARSIRPVPPELQNKNKFYNSDAHSVRSVGLAGPGNFHSSPITTLDDLIRYIKTPGRPR